MIPLGTNQDSALSLLAIGIERLANGTATEPPIIGQASLEATIKTATLSPSPCFVQVSATVPTVMLDATTTQFVV